MIRWVDEIVSVMHILRSPRLVERKSFSANGKRDRALILVRVTFVGRFLGFHTCKGYEMLKKITLQILRRITGKAQLVRMATGSGIPFGVYSIMAGIGFPLEGLMWATAVCFCVLGWRMVADSKLDGFAGISALLVIVQFIGIFLERHGLVPFSHALYFFLLGVGVIVFAFCHPPLFQALTDDLFDDLFYSETFRQSPCYTLCWRIVNLMWGALFIVKSSLLFITYDTLAPDKIEYVHSLLHWPFYLILTASSIWFIRLYLNNKQKQTR